MDGHVQTLISEVEGRTKVCDVELLHQEMEDVFQLCLLGTEKNWSKMHVSNQNKSRLYLW